MVIAVQIMMVIVGAIIGFVTSPFAIPLMGNPVGNLVLFKCADRLRYQRGLRVKRFKSDSAAM